MAETELDHQIDELARISMLTRPDPGSVLFAGRAGGRLLDNCKYAFLEACRTDYGFSPLFLTWRKEEYACLRGANLPAAIFPADIRKIASCGSVVCDDFWWRGDPVYALLHNRPSFQLWHGIPLKAIGHSEIQSAVNMDEEKAKYLRAMYSGYSAVLSTSEYVRANIFSRVFFDGEFALTGYPRNDVLLRKPTALDLLGSDAALLGRVRAHKRSGGKVGFFMPTFRDSGGDVFSDGALDCGKLNALCGECGLLLLIKLHPFVKIEVHGQLANVAIMQSEHDAYPLLGQADFLITDYSSVYFDFLLTGRPVLFYTYDLEKYTSRDREFMLDFTAMSPGRKVCSQDGLFTAIRELAAGHDDGFSAQREDMASLLFAVRDAGSSQRVCEFIRDRLLPLAAEKLPAKTP